MSQTGGQAISGEFNSQSDANTLWALATMGRKPAERIMGKLERRAEAISDMKHEILAWAVRSSLPSPVPAPLLMMLHGHPHLIWHLLMLHGHPHFCSQAG
jgi:hypothetical protein